MQSSRHHGVLSALKSVLGKPTAVVQDTTASHLPLPYTDSQQTAALIWDPMVPSSE